MTVWWNEHRQRWMFDFVVALERHQGYCLKADGTPAKTRREATAIEEELKVALRRAGGVKPSRPGSYSLAQGMDAYAATRRPGRNFEENQRCYMAELLEYFGPATALGDIGEGEINAYIAWARQQPVMIWIGGSNKDRDRTNKKWWKPHPDGRKRSDATINRYLDCLRATFGIAHKTRDRFTGQAILPFPPKVPELEEVEHLARPIPNEAIGAILDNAASHAAEAAALSNHFPMRKMEVLTRKIQHCDPFLRGIWIRGEETKAGRDEFMPASDAAWAFVEFLIAQAKRRGTDYLIAYLPPGKNKQWRPVKDIRRAWKTAQREAGIAQPYRFHDNKAAFSTNLLEATDDIETVRKASRHRQVSTTRVYLNTLEARRRTAVEKMAGETVTTAFMRRRAAEKE